jgi:hypothetical protein
MDVGCQESQDAYAYSLTDSLAHLCEAANCVLRQRQSRAVAVVRRLPHVFERQRLVERSNGEAETVIVAATSHHR